MVAASAACGCSIYSIGSACDAATASDTAHGPSRASPMRASDRRVSTSSVLPASSKQGGRRTREGISNQRAAGAGPTFPDLPGPARYPPSAARVRAPSCLTRLGAAAAASAAGVGAAARRGDIWRASSSSSSSATSWWPAWLLHAAGSATWTEPRGDAAALHWARSDASAQPKCVTQPGAWRSRGERPPQRGQAKP